MARPRKRDASRKTAEKTTVAEAVDRARKTRQRAIIITASVVVLILAVIFISLYIGTANFRRTIIIVDDTHISMDYFLNRARLSGSSATSLLEVIAKEEVIRIEAPEYGVSVSADDIDRELKKLAESESGEISESEYREWYRQQLNESKLSNSEFRHLVGTNLLINRFHELLADRLPTVAEHIHLHVIVVETKEEADQVRQRWEGGEDFADLARELSLDGESRENGGDVGWVPRGVLVPAFEWEVFDLNSGNVSTPIPYSTNPDDPSSAEFLYYLFMVSEKDDAREIEEDSLEVIKGQALDMWYSQEVYYHDITYHGLNNGFDSETAAWISWQLAKSQ
ncbi:MAG: peptidylprolyl isomerase [Dehalococcoidales bacterium]|nr:MAG: peptidylprolyl isomerase [Dehalococcoidales bacterium]